MQFHLQRRQVGSKLCDRLIPGTAILLQCLHYNLLEATRYFSRKYERSGPGVQYQVNHLGGRSRFEGRDACEHLVNHNTQTPDVRSFIDPPGFTQLFGRHVLDCPH
jgi:hypothetical protein